MEKQTSLLVEVVTENKGIEPDGYTSFRFWNEGDDPATILNGIRCEKGDVERVFDMPVNTTVNQKIPVIFDGLSVNKKIVFVKIYHK